VRIIEVYFDHGMGLTANGPGHGKDGEIHGHHQTTDGTP
jgi:hypothetical protein